MLFFVTRFDVKCSIELVILKAGTQQRSLSAEAYSYTGKDEGLSLSFCLACYL